MLDNEAYQEGYDAYWHAVDPDDNPYVSQSDRHFHWDQGRAQAQMEDLEEPGE